VKIAFVTETFPPEINGVAMTFSIIAREMGRRHSVTVYRPNRPGLKTRPVPAEYREVALPGLPIPKYPELRLGLPAGRVFRRDWKASRPDVVHVATEGPMGASAISAARAMRIPVTSSFHTNFHTYTRHYGIAPLRHLAFAWLRRVHNRTCLTFAPTAELRDQLAAAGFRSMTVLSRGVDARFRPSRRSEELRRTWGAETGDPVVLHVGRMAPEKNYPLLLRVFAAMRAAVPRSHFVLVGDGPQRARLQRDLPGGIFPGFVSRDELARHYASADIYIHASLTETFGNVLTEAMASGLAVAAFNYAAALEFVQNEDTGLVVPPGDSDALTSAAMRLISDPGLRQHLRDAAAARMAMQSWEIVISRFEAELERIATGAQTPPCLLREPWAQVT
jgi:glycosyltransferase involved in cell wall biosynthesis